MITKELFIAYNMKFKCPVYFFIIYSTLFVENDSKKQQKITTDRQLERAQSATVADTAKSISSTSNYQLVTLNNIGLYFVIFLVFAPKWPHVLDSASLA